MTKKNLEGEKGKEVEWNTLFLSLITCNADASAIELESDKKVEASF